jgi:hypothetical protein
MATLAVVRSFRGATAAPPREPSDEAHYDDHEQPIPPVHVPSRCHQVTISTRYAY